MENNHKDDIKMRIISFIIGVLVGAIISTSAFIISVNVLGANNSNGGQSAQMPGSGTPPVAETVSHQPCQAKIAIKTTIKAITNPREDA